MKVTITNNGILDIYGNKIKNLRYHYNDCVEIEDCLLVIDLFNALEQYIPIIETDFISDTRGWSIKGFFDQVKLDTNEDNNLLKSLNFEWVYECWTSKNLKTDKYESRL